MPATDVAVESAVVVPIAAAVAPVAAPPVR